MRTALRAIGAGLALGLCSCGSPAERSVGPGLSLNHTETSLDLALDPSGGVPTLERCGRGEIVQRVGDGYRCRPVLDTLLDAPAATIGETQAVRDKVDALTTKLDDPCGARGASRRPEFDMVSTECQPWSLPGAPRRVWWSLGNKLKFRYSRSGVLLTGRFRATCPLELRCGPWDGVWNTLSVFHHDPDGSGEQAELRVWLMEGDHVLDVCLPNGCALSSSRDGANDVMSVSLRGFVPNVARAQRDPNYYRVEVELELSSNEPGELQFAGLRIE